MAPRKTTRDMASYWIPRNWKEWSYTLALGGVVMLLLVILFVPDFPSSDLFVWVALAVFLLVAAGKLRTWFAVKRMPRVPKEP